MAGHRGALEASEVLSGSQREADEERHSQVEAWEEEDLSYLEAQVDLRKKESHNVGKYLPLIICCKHSHV